MDDHPRSVHNWSSCEITTWQNSDLNGNLWPFWYRCMCSTIWAINVLYFHNRLKLCAWLRWSFMAFPRSPSFKYIISHIFTCKQERCRHFVNDLQPYCHCHDSSANQIVAFTLIYSSLSSRENFLLLSFIILSSFITKHAHLSFNLLDIYSSDKSHNNPICPFMLYY